MSDENRIKIRVGPMLARIKLEAERAGLPVATWCAHAIAERLGVEPPDLRPGSAANAETAKRALDARWWKKC